MQTVNSSLLLTLTPEGQRLQCVTSPHVKGSQGYPSHKKGLAQGPRLKPTVGSQGKAFSYAQGTPVGTLHGLSTLHVPVAVHGHLTCKKAHSPRTLP